MKKLAMLFLVFMMAFNVSATENISVTINGEMLECDVPPIMENDRVLVPLRAIFEALDTKVEWDGDTNTIFAIAQNSIIILQINSTTAFINGETKTLDAPAKLIDSRTMVPIRFVAESLGAQVDWDETNNTVIIKK